MHFDPESLRDSDAVTKEEGLLLEALVRAVKPKLCYETGTHKGVSSAYIARGLEANGSGHLHTCDPIDLGASSGLQGASDWVTYHQCEGVKVPIHGKINFLFIDGCHEKEEVIKEFKYFEPHLAEDAIVVFHDCHPHGPVALGEIPSADVLGALNDLGINYTIIPTFNRMAIHDRLYLWQELNSTTGAGTAI